GDRAAPAAPALNHPPVDAPATNRDSARRRHSGAMGSLTPSIKKVILMSIAPSRLRSALAWPVAFHVLIIIASNYLMQLPCTLFGFHTTWGAFKIGRAHV